MISERMLKMFLAYNEVKHSKGKFFLIVFIMLLIAWLVFILSGLANGLSEGNRRAIDQWEIDGIVLAEDSNKSLTASVLPTSVVDDVDAKTKEPIGYAFFAAEKAGSKQEERDNVAVFGLEEKSSFLPKLTKGDYPKADGEVIMSEEMANLGYKVGDKIILGSNEEEQTIVGTFGSSTYNIAPVLYTTIPNWSALKYGKDATEKMENQQVSGVLYRKPAKKVIDKDKYESLPTEKFISNIPGYTEQNLTLDGMIYFLLVIAAFVIGVFIYVMTLQKLNMFGILKVQGVPNGFLARSVLLQTFLLAVLGVALGSLITYITTLFLPESMPFAADIKEMAIYAVGLIIVAVIGGAFSIRTVAKANPLDAIGG